MDKQLQALENAARQDPGSIEKLEALARHCRRVDWPFLGRSWRGWMELLLRDPAAPNLAFWTGEANPARLLRPVRLRFLSALLDAALDAGRPSAERCRAVMALYPLARPPEGPRLLALLDEADPELRLAVVRTLGRCGSGDPACFRKLDQVAAEATDPRLQRALSAALLGAASDLGQLESGLRAHLRVARPGLTGAFQRGLADWARFDPPGMKRLLLDQVSTFDSPSGDIPIELLLRFDMLGPHEIEALLERGLREDALLFARLVYRMAERFARAPALLGLALRGIDDRVWAIREAALRSVSRSGLRDRASVRRALTRASRHPHEGTVDLALRVAVSFWPEEDAWWEAILWRWTATRPRPGLAQVLRFRQLWPEAARFLVVSDRERSPRLDAWAARFFPAP